MAGEGRLISNLPRSKSWRLSDIDKLHIGEDSEGKLHVRITRNNVDTFKDVVEWAKDSYGSRIQRL